MKKWIVYLKRPELGVCWLGLLTVVIFAYAMFQGGFVSWFLFYSMLPVFLYVVAVAVYPIGKLEVERSLNGEVFSSGAKLKVTITVARKSWFPLLFLIVDDLLPDKLGEKADGEAKDFRSAARAMFFPGFQRKLQYSYTVEPLPRGEFDLSEMVLKTGDIFGWFQKSRIHSIEQHILVYPSYEKVQSWDAFEQHDEGTRKGRHYFQFDLTSVASVRDYSPGDRLSWLDWKSTARTNKLLTKEFEQPLNEDLIVCLDRHSTHYRGREDLFERGVVAAASMVRYGIKHGSSVGFVSYGKEKTIFSLSGEKQQQWRVFHHLASAQPDGTGNYFPLVSQSFRRFSSRANIVYITPELNDLLFRLLEELTRRKQKVDLFLLQSEHGASDMNTASLQRLRKRGIGVYLLNRTDLNEVLKAGIRYATN